MKILDCTLRDGGYYNNWDFDDTLVEEYCRCLNLLPIEYIEIGYRSIEYNQYMGEYFYLPLSTLEKVSKYTTKKLSIMINAKDCESINIKDLIGETQRYISLVRIATDPNKIELSLKLAREIKQMGLNVGLNIMYISTIDNNHKIFKYLKDITEFVDYLYLVDSYGSIYPNDLVSLIKKIHEQTDIELGFHGHNNLELAFSNTLKALEYNVTFIDSTILGMGRGAGNLKTELILNYMKAKKDINVDLNILTKVTEVFTPLYKKYKWGTNIAYMVSGSYSLPQKDVMKSLEINRYSLSSIVNRLNSNDINILEKLNASDTFKECLIIGGGESVKIHLKAIKEYVDKNPNILLLHSTSKYIDSFKKVNNNQYFAVAGGELLMFKELNHIKKYIFEPNPRKVQNSINIKQSFFELKSINFINKYFDSPLTLSLQITIDINIENILLVGFDGYGELKNQKDLYLMNENQAIIDEFTKSKGLLSLTPTKYKNILQSSIYGLIS